ncbi:MAG: hypothetical protein KF729_08315 [Sandaracinaceae bacterium]|nr:hypothetical protein [Sandaracinaceae bacterium]
MKSDIPNTDLAKVEGDVRCLVARLYEVLEQAGDGALAAALPWTEGPSPDLASLATEPLAQASSIAFLLRSHAEENAATQYRRALDREGRVGRRPCPYGKRA